MTLDKPLDKILFFDIETAGTTNHADSLSPKMQELWSAKAEILKNQSESLSP